MFPPFFNAATTSSSLPTFKAKALLQNINPNNREIELTNNVKIKYQYLFNCTGLNSDRVASSFSIGKNYTLLPFKGLYWKVRKESFLDIKVNLYPVPDLNVPFLGIHFTPNYLNNSISIGPTAIPALGRENYKLLEKIEFNNAIGLAPIVKTSLKIPPTPVAAP